MRLITILILWLGLHQSALFNPLAWAGPDGERYASIAVDVDSQEILHARQIDDLRYPASLTKMMTLYLAFDAIEAGQLGLDDKLPVSAAAAAAPPSKLGLRKGQNLSVHEAIQALSIKSANDVAIVIAEAIAGSESGFALRMNAKAKELSMNQTVYRNASGLPHSEQVTTARDQAKLADSLLRYHRKYYHYFGQKSFNFRGQELLSHNKLLGSVEGVDGFKTGYTRASGFNLTISAQRDGRRIIAVVLGGASSLARNTHMTRLVDRAFDVIADRPFTIAPPPVMPAKADTVLARHIVRRPVSEAEKPLQAFEIRGRAGNTVNLITGSGADPALCKAISQTDQSCLIVPQG